MKKILGIETTCDETSAAVVENGRIVLSNIVASQEKLHEKYGGIVPEVASRKHLEVLPVVIDEAFKKAKTKIDEIEAIAVSKEPGLPPALSVGYGYASALALSSKIPLIEVNHLDAHMSGIWLVKDSKYIKEIPYPYICLLVSGGHTQIHLVSEDKSSKVLGKTRDDAAGEAFDKVARLLDLGYPGGPVIDRLAKEGDEQLFNFPRPMLKSENYDFSFSGLKTAVRREVEKLRREYDGYKDKKKLYEELSNNWTADIAASFQEAVVDTLVTKTIDAASELGINVVTMAGGVSANSRLRDKLARECHEAGFELYYPEMEFCLDNAAMVAARAFELIKQ
jgi:N6-L-threonylcarbamoyladenine synthase